MSDYVTWPRLFEWAKDHGAINESIIDMRIGVRHIDGEAQGVVTITGRAQDDNGYPIMLRPSNEPALWTITRVLRSLP